MKVFIADMGETIDKLSMRTTFSLADVAFPSVFGFTAAVMETFYRIDFLSPVESEALCGPLM